MNVLATRVKNGGACTDGVNKYNCVCESGFEDANCQTGRSDCLVGNAVRDDVRVLTEVLRIIITSLRHYYPNYNSVR